MAAHDSKLERLPARKDRFATTHWSMVVSAGASTADTFGGPDMNKGKTQRLVVCLVILSVCRTTETLGLELREWVADRGIAASGQPLPSDAARAFVYEGTPLGIRVTGTHCAIDYGRSGVLFDRANGEPLRRWTILDGWPREPRRVSAVFSVRTPSAAVGRSRRAQPVPASLRWRPWPRCHTTGNGLPGQVCRENVASGATQAISQSGQTP